MNSENTDMNNRRTARVLTVACGLLFVAFSLVYLAIFQKDLMEAYHFTLAHGKTVYSVWTNALLITIVMLVLRWAVNGLVRLKGAFYALSYFPSCMLLGVLTDVSHGLYHGESVEVRWTWLLPILLFGLTRILSWCDLRMSQRATINTNLLVLLLLCLMTIYIGNTNIHFHHELSVEKALREQDYAKARLIGEKTMNPSRNLTALRAYAMSREGTMGEYLFHYPQLYGAEGLLIESSNKKTLRLNADSLYVYLGARPLAGESSLAFFDRICHEESGNYTTLDYYLSALLLEKKLDRFALEFGRLYTIQEEVPLYYAEALYMYGKMHPDASLETEDETMDERWKAYQQRKSELAGAVGEGNLMRREYGDTYWWYYEYR